MNKTRRTVTVSVAVVGPDGAGKTTLVADLEKHLKNTRPVSKLFMEVRNQINFLKITKFSFFIYILP